MRRAEVVGYKVHHTQWGTIALIHRIEKINYAVRFSDRLIEALSTLSRALWPRMPCSLLQDLSQKDQEIDLLTELFVKMVITQQLILRSPNSSHIQISAFANHEKNRS